MKKFKRGMAAVIAAALIVSAMPFQTAYASAGSGEQEVAAEVGEETDGLISENMDSSNDDLANQDFTGEENKADMSESTEGLENSNDDPQTVDEGQTQNKEIPEKQSMEELEEQEETADDSEQSRIQELLNYLVVDKPYVEIGEIQNIVLSIGTGEEAIDSATLKYHRESDNSTYEISATKIEQDGLRFEMPYEDEAQTGIYILDEVSYIKNEVQYTIIFDETGINAKYGVNTETETNPDAEVVDEESEYNVEVSVSSFDEDGNQVSENSIQDAIMAQQEQIPSVMTADSSSSKNVVVVLDPGHDATHAGAQGYVKEEELTLKIAQYCKAELEQYSGVTVYMTRNSTSCPYPGTTSAEDNKKRVEYAASVGANVYVSIHLNSAETSSAYGAEVYYPNSNYKPEIGEQGHELAEAVLDQLVALGLNDRGTKIRSTVDKVPEWQYPDGSQQDYYSVIKNSKLNGFPGIIIEHAFVTNKSDVDKYLSSEESLKKLGVADATGIASYFGLSKDKEYGVGEAKITALANSNETQYTISAAGISEAYAVRYAVWSKADGQDDLKWYTASKDSSGKWNAIVPLNNHKTGGEYNVHAYIVRSTGSSYFVGGITFNVEVATITELQITNIDEKAGTFDVIVSGVSSKRGIDKVKMAVWSGAGQSDLVWYVAQKQSDGTYISSIDISKHDCNYGTYNVHVYLTDTCGIRAFGMGKTVTISQPNSTLKASLNTTETRSNISLSDVPQIYDVTQMRFAVWSTAGGQDDLIWYTANKNGDGVWTYSVPISSHKTSGIYNVHAYATLSTGKRVFLGGTTFNVSSPSANSIRVIDKDTSSGTFDVSLEGVSSKCGIDIVQFAVWSQSNQSDMKWYIGKRQIDGSYRIQVNVANHSLNYGTYNVHAYLTDLNGIRAFGCGGTVEFKASALINASLNSTGEIANVKISNVPYGAYATQVKFAVWSVKNGQDDLIWYSAFKENEGNWYFNVPLNNHKTAGTYNVHAYVTIATGKQIFLGGTTFSVVGPEADSVVIQNKDEQEGTVEVKISGVSSGTNIKNVQVAVWSKSNQSDLMWYTAKKIANGEYVAYVDRKNHDNNSGTYKADVYITDTINIRTFIERVTIEFFYNIMKVPTTTVDQMMNYYNAKATYPDYYSNTDAKTIQQFCQLYYNECVTEGVDPAVAFCQAMKETNFLQYGGIVQIEQLNFAGLDATGAIKDDGTIENGRTYESVQLGIRAHVQRLKAYAVSGTTKDSFQNPCVDADKYTVWWMSNIVGCAPYVEWLGCKENPSGNGWATSENYGYSIKNDYMAKLYTY